MNVIQYTTTKSNLYPMQEYRKRKLKPSVFMTGASTATANVNPLDTNFLGFGVALTGSSCYNLNKMEPEKRTEFLKSIFSKDGLNLSVGRITIGSCDYADELYSYDDVENDIELKHFSIERDMEYIIPMIKEILKINPDIYFYASPWSPPGWMKTGGSMCGGYMREAYLDCYSEYIIRFLQSYEAEGIKIKALTTQNETETDQSGRMPACIWHPEIEAKFIHILRQKLTQNNLSTEIWMYDHNFSGTDRVIWTLDNYKNLLEECNGVAFHYYAGNIEQTQIIKEKYPEISLHFTEAGPRLFDHYDDDWCKWGILMSRVLNLGYSSFTGFNLVLDEVGEPNIGPFFCGGLVTVDSTTQELSFSGQYKTFRHFAPHIRKGAKIYPISFTNNGTYEMSPVTKSIIPLEGCLAINPDNSHTLILVNNNDTKRQTQYFYNNSWWYIELLPDSVSTILFK